MKTSQRPGKRGDPFNQAREVSHRPGAVGMILIGALTAWLVAVLRMGYVLFAIPLYPMPLRMQ